jgi:hypothetical protein
MRRRLFTLLAATLPSVSPSAGAAGSCVLEVDGEPHSMPHIVVVVSPTTVSDLQGVHPVTEHWVLCTMAPLEPRQELMGDPLGAYQMAALMLDDDDRVEVQLAHDGRVRRVNAHRGDFVGSPPLDGDLPIAFAGDLAGARARGTLATRTPVLQPPTPWFDREARWELRVELDGVPIVGREVEADADSTDPAAPTPVEGGPPGGTVALSSAARQASGALRALEAALPQPPAIVQLVVFQGGVATATVVGNGETVDYRLLAGSVQGPEPMDPQYLPCPAALPPGAVDLAALGPLWDDAPARAGAPESGTLQIVVSQHPCGTPWVQVTVEGPRSVYYAGDGSFLRSD